MSSFSKLDSSYQIFYKGDALPDGSIATTRKYYNIRTGEIISLRKYQTATRGGVSYEQSRKTATTPKREYKPRKPKDTNVIKAPKEKAPKEKAPKEKAPKEKAPPSKSHPKYTIEQKTQTATRISNFDTIEEVAHHKFRQRKDALCYLVGYGLLIVDSDEGKADGVEVWRALTRLTNLKSLQKELDNPDSNLYGDAVTRALVYFGGLEFVQQFGVMFITPKEKKV